MAWQSVGQLGSASGISAVTPSSRTSAWAGAAATRAPTQAKAVAKRRIGKIEHGPSTQVALPIRHRARVPSPGASGYGPPVDLFEQHVRAGLELAGMTVDETDIAVMRAADAV